MVLLGLVLAAAIYARIKLERQYKKICEEERAYLSGKEERMSCL